MPKVVSEGRRVINNVQQTAMLYLVKTLFMTVLAVLTAAGFFTIFGPVVVDTHVEDFTWLNDKNRAKNKR